jgi:uncharacterized protein (TIGR03083 family)
MDHWTTIAAERRALADQLEALTDAQWATPSLCDGWTVHDVAAHLAGVNLIKMSEVVVALARSRFSFARANRVMVARQAARPSAEIVADLRRLADGRFAPPGLGSVAPLTDILVHGQDIRIPLGLATDRPVQPWRDSLDFLVTKKARRGFVGKALPGLRFSATDLGWSHGEGAGNEVSGPAIAVALALLGRPALVDQLEGPGMPALKEWLTR